MGTPTSQDETQTTNPGKRLGIGCLGLLVVLILIGAAMLASTLGTTGDSPEARKAGATRACQDWVRDQLRAPSTATFPTPTATGTGPWVITGQVDAQNTLGGIVRETWTCDVRLVGDTFRGSARITQ